MTTTRGWCGNVTRAKAKDTAWSVIRETVHGTVTVVLRRQVSSDAHEILRLDMSQAEAERMARDILGVGVRPPARGGEGSLTKEPTP